MKNPITYPLDKQKQRMKVLCAGIFSLILVMGIARFSYTPLLPLMQKQAGLDIAGAGWLAAINYAGYLVGAMFASLINDLVLKDRLYRVGMIVAVASTVLMGLTDHFTVWAISRFFAGLSSAAGLMFGSGLILNWLIRHDQRSELGIHFSGVGLGIVVCSAAVILMKPWLDWCEQWFVLTVIGLFLLIPALAWLPKPDQSTITSSGEAMLDSPPTSHFMRILMAAYFCAGFGYVVTATFIVAIVDQLPELSGSGIWVLLVIGLAAAPSCMLWDLIARKVGELRALVWASALQIIGIILPALGGGLLGAMLGALLFGGTCMGVVSLVLTMAGRFYPTRPAKMMGKMALSYGAAQIIGPAITGALAASVGSYSAGLYIAAGLMGLASVLFWMLQGID